MKNGGYSYVCFEKFTNIRGMYQEKNYQKVKQQPSVYDRSWSLHPTAKPTYCKKSRHRATDLKPDGS